MMAELFISYSRRDSDFVRRLHERLTETYQRDVWVDWEDIPLSADWWQEIATAIEAADTMLFIISPDSVRSEVCAKEIAHAVSNNKRIVPILYRPLSKEEEPLAHPSVRTYNWVKLTAEVDFDNSVANLVRALDTDLAHVKQHTRLLVRSREWEQKQSSASYLLNGAEVREFRAFMEASKTKDPKPNELQYEYYLASEQHMQRRVRATLLLAIIGLIIGFGLLASTLVSRQQALESEATRVAFEQLSAADRATSAVQATLLADQRATNEFQRIVATDQQATSIARSTQIAQEQQDRLDEARNVFATLTQQANFGETATAIVNTLEAVSFLQGALDEASTLVADLAATSTSIAKQPTPDLAATSDNLATQAVGTVGTQVADAFFMQLTDQANSSGQNATETQSAALAATGAAYSSGLFATETAQAMPPAPTQNVASSTGDAGDSPTDTASPTATATDTASPTATATATASPTATATATASPTATATDTASPTETSSPTATVTATLTPSPQFQAVEGNWYVSNGGNDDNPCSAPEVPCASIGAALVRAEAGDQVNIALGIYNENVVVEKSLTLIGENPAYTIINGNNSASVLAIGLDARVELQNLTLQGGQAEYGGGILNFGTLYVDGLTVSSNTASKAGGGIANFGALILENSVINNNISQWAAAIYDAWQARSVISSDNIIGGNTASSGIGGDSYTETCPPDVRTLYEEGLSPCSGLNEGVLCVLQSPVQDGQRADLGAPGAQSNAYALDTVFLGRGDSAGRGVAVLNVPISEPNAPAGEPIPVLLWGASEVDYSFETLGVGSLALVDVGLQENLNVRRTPGLSGEIVTGVYSGLVVTVIESPVEVDNLAWWRIRLPDGSDGWVVATVENQPTLVPLNFGAPQIAGRYTVSVIGRGLNLRAEPSTDAEVVRLIPIGQDVSVLDGPVDADNIRWWYVRALVGGDEGWLAENVDGAQALIPVVPRRIAYPTAYYFVNDVCRPINDNPLLYTTSNGALLRLSYLSVRN